MKVMKLDLCMFSSWFEMHSVVTRVMHALLS